MTAPHITMLSFLLLVLLLLVNSVTANDFLGTVMTYYPKNTEADGSVAVFLRYKQNFQSCSSVVWQCASGICGSESMVVQTVRMDSSEMWCQTEELSTRLVPSNAPFQLQLDAGNWTSFSKNNISVARALTLVELRNRSDTGQPNSSPHTTILPVVRVPSNCQRDLNLLAYDPDGDEVKCRYGSELQSDCLNCTSPSVLSLSSACTLSFSPTSSSDEGLYAVQLVMEDFPRQSIILTQTDGSQSTKTTNDAISKVPVQFLFRVDPAVPDCTEGIYLPRFLPPTPANGAQLNATVNSVLEINITARSETSKISKLLFSGPYSVTNVTQDVLGPGRFILRWTPSESEAGTSQPICFVVKALFNGTSYHSDLRCVIVRVREELSIQPTTPSTTPSTSSLPAYVVALRVRLSTSLSVSEITSDSILTQIKNVLLSSGVPADVNLRILSVVALTS